MVTDRLLTTREVAERLKLNPRTVTRFAKKGKIPKPVKKEHRLGKADVWKESDINRAIANMECES